MKLRRLIDDGEKFANINENIGYNKSALEDQGENWARKGSEFLQDNYPESVLTKDFMAESERNDKNYQTMLSILKGLKDVEDEIGMLDECIKD